MLETLTIRQIALIDDVTIRFHDGIHVLTGETGAGKSIVVWCNLSRSIFYVFCCLDCYFYDYSSFLVFADPTVEGLVEALNTDSVDDLLDTSCDEELFCVDAEALLTVVLFVLLLVLVVF